MRWVTNHDIREMRRLRMQQISCEDVGALLGFSNQTVWRHTKDLPVRLFGGRRIVGHAEKSTRDTRLLAAWSSVDRGERADVARRFGFASVNAAYVTVSRLRRAMREAA